MDVYTIDRAIRILATTLNYCTFFTLGKLFSRNLINIYEMFIFRFYIDRKFLKNLIHYLPLDSKNVLWVGCRRYNKFEYNLLNNNNCILTLIDIDPHVKKFSYGNNFICNDISKQNICFDSKFDIIFMNGVFGDGLNNIADQERALCNLDSSINTNSIIIIGLNTGNHPCASNNTVTLLEKFGYFCLANIQRAKHSFYIKYSN